MVAGAVYNTKYADETTFVDRLACDALATAGFGHFYGRIGHSNARCIRGIIGNILVVAGCYEYRLLWSKWMHGARVKRQSVSNIGSTF